MKPLPSALDEYLALRRSLGYKLWEECRLPPIRGIRRRERGGVYHHGPRPDLGDPAAGGIFALLVSPAQGRPTLRRVLQRSRPANRGASSRPACSSLPAAHTLIYRDEEVGRLLAAAAELPSKTGLRPRTFVTLFGLYAVTGLRCREPLQLDRTDVDWQIGALTIRGTKFGKSRLVPLHPSTVDALRAYAVCRDRLCRNPDSPSFFLSEAGTRLSHWAVRAAFVTLSHRIGLRGPNDSRGPRLHDLRHRMAVNTLLRWYREGVDVERHLPTLATYLGHAHITDTYWYLTATPELLQQAMLRLEQPDSGALP